MSFFIREKTVSRKTKKFSTVNNVKRKSEPIKSKKFDEDIESDDEIHGNHKSYPDISDNEDDIETPEAKRLRLAKQYLDKIKSSDDEDEDIDQKLKSDYLDSVGKLKKYIADTVNTYDNNNIIKLKHKLQNQSITCLCVWSEKKILFSGSKSGTILKWSIEGKKMINHVKLKSAIMCMCLSSDYKYLVASDKSQIIDVYDPVDMKKLHSFDGHRGQVNGLAFRKDTHQLFSCSNDRTVKIWSLDEMSYVETLFGHQSAVTSIDSLYKERALTAGGSDCTLRIWKVVEESQLVYNGYSGSIDCVRFINNETFISCADNGSICVWSVGKKRPMCELKLAHGKSLIGVPNWINVIATLVNSDLIASGSCDGFIRIWKIERNYRSLTMKMEIPAVGFVNSLQFLHDGNELMLIAGLGQEHRLGRWWNLKDSKNIIMVIPILLNKT